MFHRRALRASLLALLLSPLSLVACGEENQDDTGDTSEVDCATTPAPKYSEMAAVWAKCTACHAESLAGAARNNAPVGVDFDTHESAMAEAMDALERVEAGTMPPAGKPALTADEEAQLSRWVSCGTPE